MTDVARGVNQPRVTGAARRSAPVMNPTNDQGETELTIAGRIMNLTGTEWCGNKQVPAPPPLYSIGSGRKTRFHRGHDAEYDRDRDLVHVFTTNNDSFELWIGYPDKWLFHCRRKEARRLAVYILWDWWIRTEWFGLRRWVYYRALHTEVQRHKRHMAEARRARKA